MTGMVARSVLLSALLGLALLVLVVVTITWLAKRASPSSSRTEEGLEEVLRRRYAAGKLYREESLRMQSELTRR